MLVAKLSTNLCIEEPLRVNRCGEKNQCFRLFYKNDQFCLLTVNSYVYFFVCAVKRQGSLFTIVSLKTNSEDSLT
jgi:hypothetical protein